MIEYPRTRSDLPSPGADSIPLRSGGWRGGESVGGRALDAHLSLCETVHFLPEVVHGSLERAPVGIRCGLFRLSSRIRCGPVRLSSRIRCGPMRFHRILEPINAPVRAGGRADDEGGEGDGRPDDGEEFGGDVHVEECSTVSAEYLGHVTAKVRRLGGR